MMETVGEAHHSWNTQAVFGADRIRIGHFPFKVETSVKYMSYELLLDLQADAELYDFLVAQFQVGDLCCLICAVLLDQEK